MRRILPIMVILAASIWSCDMTDNATSSEEAIVVHFQDPALEASIREQIGKPEGDIYQSDVVFQPYLFVENEDITNLSGLEYFENLDQIFLNTPRVSDYSVLTRLPHLRTVSLSYVSNAGVDAVRTLTQLEELDFFNGPYSGTLPLQSFENLRALKIGYIPISDIAGISELPKLSTLYIYGTGVTDLSPLETLPSLQYLTFNGELDDYESISHLTSLTSLSIDNADNDILRRIANIPNLDRLTLYGQELSDLTPIERLENLRLFGISNCSVSDISPLCGLSNLEQLYLNYTLVEDIDCIARFPKLKYFVVSGNHSLNSIHSLQFANQLQGVSVYGSPNIDLQPLVDNPFFGSGDFLEIRTYVENLPASTRSQLDQLRRRGVRIYN